MPMYALRWPDRSVSITFADSEEEAIVDFDEINDPSNLEIVELDTALPITFVLGPDNDFRLGGKSGPSGDLREELMEKCFADLN